MIGDDQLQVPRGCRTCEKHIIILALNKDIFQLRIFQKEGHMIFRKTPTSRSTQHSNTALHTRHQEAQHSNTALHTNIKKHTALGHSHPNIMVIN